MIEQFTVSWWESIRQEIEEHIYNLSQNFWEGPGILIAIILIIIWVLLRF